MKIKFSDTGHREFFLSMQDKVQLWDCYHKALFYVLGICPDCRKNISRLYDFKEDCIKSEGLLDGWQTSGSITICRLAFNLWNDYTGEDAGNFTVSNIFCSEYALYMWQGIKLRYPEYCVKERLQITDEEGQAVEENISSEFLAENYVKIYERENQGKSYRVEPMPDIVLDV